VAKRRPNFNQVVRRLIRDIAAQMPEFSHIKASRILIVAGEARRASRGSIKPLMINPVNRRRKPVVKFNGRRMLYCITLRPLFFRSSTAHDRIGTLLHELFHISPLFDGTLDEQRRHETVGRGFSAKLRPLVRRYLRQCPPELWAAFAYDGEVWVQQWLERPSASLIRGKRGVRLVYTEVQLFRAPVRMITRSTRPLRDA
jgi:hypothetical protein